MMVWKANGWCLTMAMMVMVVTSEILPNLEERIGRLACSCLSWWQNKSNKHLESIKSQSFAARRSLT